MLSKQWLMNKILNEGRLGLSTIFFLEFLSILNEFEMVFTNITYKYLRKWTFVEQVLTLKIET